MRVRIRSMVGLAAIALSAGCATPTVQTESAGPVPAAAADCVVTVTALPTGAGGRGGAVYDASPKGYVGKISLTDGTSHPSQWAAGPDGFAVQDLGLRDGLTSGWVATATDSGEFLIVLVDSSQAHARTYVVSGRAWRPLTGPDGGVDVWGVNENEHGDVLAAYLADDEWRPAVWPAGGPVRVLHPLSGFRWSRAAWLSNAGDVVGQSANDAAVSEPTVWPHAGRAIPGPRFVTPTGRYDALKYANDNGRVGGALLAADHTTHAVVSDPGSAPVDLPPLSGDDLAVIWAVDSAGNAVGDSALTTSGRARALYWPGHGTAIVLPGLAGTGSDQRSAGYGIDDSGHAWGESSRSLAGDVQPVVWSCLSGGPVEGRQEQAARPAQPPPGAKPQDLPDRAPSPPESEPSR